jgi:hypothetical protein
MSLFARYAACALALVACACGNDGSSGATTMAGPGGAGGSAGAGEAGGSAGAGEAGGSAGAGGSGAVGVDSGADATAADGGADVFGTTPTVAILIDDIFGGPMVDGGTWVRGQASPQWPVRYTFDTGVEGWEVTPVEPDQERPIEALVHSAEDARGATDSGSLELRTWFAPFDNSDLRVSPSEIRAFSSESGPPKNWEGYTVVAMAKVVAGGAPCFVSANLYAYAGAERQYLNSRAIDLSPQEWRPLVFDLESYRTFGDTRQIVEFGVEIRRDICIPP